MKTTKGPWAWMERGGKWELCTPHSGRLIVMEPAFAGRGKPPELRFAVDWNGRPYEDRGRNGGILYAVHPQWHPDGRAIESAPQLVSVLEEMIDVYHDDPLGGQGQQAAVVERAKLLLGYIAGEVTAT